MFPLPSLDLEVSDGVEPDVFAKEYAAFLRRVQNCLGATGLPGGSET